MPDQDRVAAWLSSLGLEMYHPVFADEGYETIDDLVILAEAGKEGLAEMVESCNEATPNGKLTKMKNRHMLRNCLARLLSVDEGEGSAESNVTPTAPTITSQTDDAPHEEAPADFGDLSFLLTEIEKVSIRRRKSKVPKKQDAKVAQSQSTPPPTPSATPSPAVATSVPDSAVRVASGSGLAPLREDSGLAASLPQSGTVAREGGAACGVDSRKAAAVKDTGIVAAPPAATGGSSWVVHPSRKGNNPNGKKKTSVKSLEEMKRDLLQSKSTLDSVTSKTAQPTLKRGHSEYR